MTYEKKVCREIDRVLPGKFKYQVGVLSGIMDAIHLGRPIIIVEIKLTQTLEAYYQLQRYAEFFVNPARVIITKTVILTTQTPEKPTYLQNITDLMNVKPGGFYIIPYQGKKL